RRPARSRACRRTRLHRSPAALRRLRPVGHRRGLDGAARGYGTGYGVRLRRAGRRSRLRRTRQRGHRGLAVGDAVGHRGLRMHRRVPVLRAVTEMRKRQRALGQGRRTASAAHRARLSASFSGHGLLPDLRKRTRYVDVDRDIGRLFAQRGPAVAHLATIAFDHLRGDLTGLARGQSAHGIRGSQCCQVRGVLGPAVGDEGLTEAADRGHEHEHDGAEPDDDVRHDGSPLSPSYLAGAEASTVARKKIAAGRLMVTVTTEYAPSARTDTAHDRPARHLASARTAARGSPRAISRAADRAASKARSWEKPTAAAPVSRTTRTTMAGMTTANSAVAVPESCSWSVNR